MTHRYRLIAVFALLLLGPAAHAQATREAASALRSGAGLVSVVCHGDHAGAMSQARPELMCRAATADADIGDMIAAADVIAIGPGLGSDSWADNLWRQVMDSDKPVIVDADALNRLARENSRRGNWVLTPHPGEAADCWAALPSRSWTTGSRQRVRWPNATTRWSCSRGRAV